MEGKKKFIIYDIYIYIYKILLYDTCIYSAISYGFNQGRC